MAITKQNAEGAESFSVRVQLRSSRFPSLRVSAQVSGIRNETEARKCESKLLKDLQRKLFEEESKRHISGQTWKYVLDHWYETQKRIRVPFGSLSQASLDDYYQSMRKWLSTFDNVPCADITSLELMELFNRLAEKGVSFTHRQKLRTRLKAVFDYGLSKGFVLAPKNPVHELVLKKAEEKKPEILTIGEIRRLVELAHVHQHEWRHVWTLALLTGMRNGELFALQWSDIDWEQKLISVSRAYNGRTKSISSTKAGYWRDVPMSQETLRLAQELRSITGGTPYVLPRLDRWGKGIQALVLRTFCIEHGLPSVKFHTLRACFGTQLLRQGVSAAIVMKIAGWKDLKTMQRYIRLAGVEVTGATDKLSVLPPIEIAANVVSFRPRAE